MARFTLEVETDNEAFSDENGEHEIARILRVVAAKITRGTHEAAIMDFNGNKVGRFEWTREG